VSEHLAHPQGLKENIGAEHSKPRDDAKRGNIARLGKAESPSQWLAPCFTSAFTVDDPLIS
jgi:hypothetical protein